MNSLMTFAYYASSHSSSGPFQYGNQSGNIHEEDKSPTIKIYNHFSKNR